MTAPTMTFPKANAKHVWSWALWDWGTSAFSVIVTTFVFPIFIVQALFAGGDETKGLESGFAWSYTVSGIIVAVLAPIMGQRADRSQKTKTWLGINTFIVGLATIAMVFLIPAPSYFIYGLVLYLIANVFYEFAFVNYNTVLVQISNPRNIGRISGFGWGLGYVGGIIALLVVLVGFVGLGDGGGAFGITQDAQLNIRMAFVFTGIWVILFTLPVLLGTPNSHAVEPGKPLGFFASYGKLFRDIARLWREERTTFAFLVASAIFRDGLAAVFTLGAVIAAVLFGFKTKDIMMFGIAANLVAGIGVFLGGVIEDRIGPKTGVKTFPVTERMGLVWIWLGGGIVEEDRRALGDHSSERRAVERRDAVEAAAIVWGPDEWVVVRSRIIARAPEHSEADLDRMHEDDPHGLRERFAHLLDPEMRGNPAG